MTSPPREIRWDLIVLGALLAFGGGFVGFATWWGKQDRTRYELAPEPELPPAQKRVAEALGLRSARMPRPADAPGAADFNQAHAELMSGRWEPASVSLERHLESRPKDADATLLLAVAYGKLDRSAAAQRMLERAASLSPEDPDASHLLARLHLAGGNPREALRAAQAAVRLAPRWVDAQATLGDACLAHGDYARAKRAFLDVLQLRPDDARARSIVQRIDGKR